MDVRAEAVRDERREDQQALDEIRRLFARYRQMARHGQAREQDTIPEARTRRDVVDRARSATRPPVRSGPSESRQATSRRS